MKRKGEVNGKKKSMKLVSLVITAMIVMALMPAFVPLAAASPDVTAFTITPTTGVAGAKSAYTATVNATAWNTLNITIPAGFEAVAPTTGRQEIVKADLYDSTGAWCANITITSNTASPSTKVDVTGYNKSKVEGDILTLDVSYSPGGKTVIKSPFAGNPDVINLTLPTATVNGSLNISLPAGLLLTNATISIGQFVKNPTKVGTYTFTTETDGIKGETATVTINPAEDVKLAVYPDTAKTADGIDKATIRVYAQDQYGNNATAATVKNIRTGEMTPSKDKPTAVLGPVTGSGTESDPFTFNVTNTVAENVTITAVDTGTTGKTLTSGTGVQRFISLTSNVTLTPSKTSIVANNSDTAIVTAQLKDAEGKNVERITSIIWSVDNTSLATVSSTSGSETFANGSATATIKGAEGYYLGTVEVRAIAEGILGRTNINLVVGPPNNTQSTIRAYNATWVDKTGGNMTVGADVVISATIKDEIPAHPPLSGETVTFSIVSSPGGEARLSEATVVSDANGHANTTLTLSTKSGKNEVRVKSAKGDVNQTAWVWGDAADVTLTAAVDSATVGTDVAISARLLDPINGTAINGTNVTFSVVSSPGGDAVVSPTVVATANGYANTTLTLSTKIGNNTVRAISTRYDVNRTVNVTGIAGNATQLNLTTDRASIRTGATATITTRLLDAHGNPTAFNATGGIGAVNVSFTQDTTEYGNLSAAYNLTVDGVTTVQFTASAKPGRTTITGSAEGLSSDSVKIFTGVPKSIRLTASPDNIRANQSDQNSTITAQLLDEDGVPISVSDVKITFMASVPGNVTLTNSSGVTGHPVVEYTNASGTAWINLTSIKDAIEKITVTAMPTRLPLKQVVVQIRGPVAKIVLSAAPQTGVVANGTDESVITAQLKDAQDNKVAEPGKEITFSATAGTLSAYSAVTDSSGAASVNLNSTTVGDITVYGVCEKFMDNVTVGFVSPAPVLTSITVAPATKTLNVTETQVFTATAYDQFGETMAGINITWTSSNTTVGTVSPAIAITGADGNATTTFSALAAGITTVTATNGTISGSATVTVEAPPVGVTVSGTVKGINQERISGATVTINGYSDTTDAYGNYTIINVPTGTYTVTANATGYREETKTGVSITSDMEINFTGDYGLLKEPCTDTTYVLQVINKWATDIITDTTKVLTQISIWAVS